MTSPAADLILHAGRFTTLDRGNPVAAAVAIRDGRFVAVGGDADVMALAGPSTRVVDLHGASALPGLIDNHSHVIRGGLNYNMELRWDGVRSLAMAVPEGSHSISSLYLMIVNAYRWRNRARAQASEDTSA